MPTEFISSLWRKLIHGASEARRALRPHRCFIVQSYITGSNLAAALPDM
jgi:hypothetical protein